MSLVEASKREWLRRKRISSEKASIRVIWTKKTKFYFNDDLPAKKTYFM